MSTIKMERRDRKRDILQMALKTSGIRDEKKRNIKCRKSLQSEFDKNSTMLTRSEPPLNVASTIVRSLALNDKTPTLTSSAPAPASTIFTCSTLDDASTNLPSSVSFDTSSMSSAPVDVSALLISSTSIDAPVISSAPVITSDTSSAPVDKPVDTSAMSSVSGVALAIPTKFAPDATCAIPTSSPILTNLPSSPEAPSNACCNSALPVSEPIFLETSILDIHSTSSSTVRIIRQEKKDYLDYMSDDEIALLNAFGDADSSDEWKPESNAKRRNKITFDLEEETVGNQAAKKIPKNKRKEATQKRSSGQSYVKTNGEVAQEKRVQPNPCVGKKCGNNCSDISEERRSSIFKHFWSLSEQRKKDWIVSLTQKTGIKRKRSKASEKRNITYKYNITDGEAHRQVCMQFMCKTIDVSHKFIYYTVSNADAFGCGKESQRGKSVPPNKTNCDDIAAIENFIKSLPAVPSHYCRKDSTRTYLPTEYKNLANLYRKYKELRIFQGLTFVSESIFRKIFNDNFNIAFHIPKKDKCLKCSQNENKTNPTAIELAAHEAHLIEKEHTYNRYKIHKTIHLTDSASLCISFDLQKVLNTPYGDSMLLFYTRKLAVYNAVIYENGTRNVYCYYWDESQGNRGANEMATILNKYIMKLEERGNIRRLLLYCDCCPGQNRNKIVLAMLNETLQRCKTIESIQINFLLTGHTYMTVDSAHATIENHVKHNTIWAPSQWYTVFQTARRNPKPFDVEQLTYKDFKRWDLLADKYFVGNLVGKISKIRVATFKKNRTSATVKFSMNPDTPISYIEVASKTKMLDVPDCYPTPLPIAENKHKDLMKLCSDQVIPQQFQADYLALTFNKKVIAVLPDSDIEDID